MKLSEIKNVKKAKKIFLGGTTNDSKWRNDLIPLLKIDYFNPVVKDWNSEAQLEEFKQRKNSDYCLYVITPKMKGVYSVAETIEDAIKRPKKTIFCILSKDGSKEFDDAQLKSLNMVAKMVEDNGGRVCKSLKDIADFVN